MADLDGDGRSELVSGSYAATIYVWPQIETGVFGERKVLIKLAHPAFRDPHLACHAVDWDGDGKTDFVIGARKGGVFLLRNTTEKGAPKAAFAALQPILLADGNPCFVKGGDAGPHAADWDGDGDLDLLVGDDHGGVTLFSNAGTRRKPKLKAGVELLAPRGGRIVEERCKSSESCAMRAKPWVVDWNHDGLPDLLVGDFHDHRTAGKTGNDSMHGWVWLYLRKPAKE